MKLLLRRLADSAAMIAGCYVRPARDASFRSKVLADSPVSYRIRLDRIESFALRGTAKGPRGILRKKRIRELLGLDRDGGR
jgi:hypothetical protein